MQKTSINAALWMLFSAFCSALMVIMVRFVEKEVSVAQMIFLRNVFAFMMFMPFVAVKGFGSFKTKRLKNHLYRALSGVFAMLILFYCIREMKASTVVAITYTTPIFASLMAYYKFQDRPGVHRIISIIIGFIGVMIVIRPGLDGFTPLSLLMLLCSFFWAVSSILIKDLGRTEQPATITFYLTMYMSLITMPIVFFWNGWVTPSFESIMWIVGIAVVSNLLQYSLAKALAMAEMSFIYPFDYARLIFTSILTFIIFHEVLDMPTVVGSIIIIASAVYTAYRESKKGKVEVKSASNIV
jgi:drug/metabolite transporter (DMT)-like permease